MARNVTVTFSDGSSHVYENAPDDLTPEQASARATKEFGKEVTHLDGGRGKTGILDTLVSSAKDVARGVANSWASQIDATRGGPEQEQLNIAAAQITPKVNQAQLPPDAAMQGVRNALPVPQDETAAGRYSRKALEGVGGVLAAGPQGGPINPVTLSAGAGMGVGSELGDRLGGGSAAGTLLGGLAGAIAGGGVASIPSRIRPQTAAMAQKALEGIDEKMLKRAAAFQLLQKSKGVEIDLAQALRGVGAPEGNLTKIRDTLATRSAGEGVKRVLQNQPEQLSALTDIELGRLPGVNYGMQQTANNLQDTATDVLTDLKQGRTAAVKGLYAKAGELPAGSKETLVNLVKKIAAQPEASTGLQSAAAKFLARVGGVEDAVSTAVADARAAVAAAKTPLERVKARDGLTQALAASEQSSSRPLHALTVDTAIGEIAAKNPLFPADPKTAGQLKGLAGALNKELQNLSPQVRAAEGEYARISREVVDPARKSVLGRIATPRGATPDREAAYSKAQTLFDNGTDPRAKVSEIRSLGETLAKRDPAVFIDAWKSWVSKRLGAAQDVHAEGPLANNPDQAARMSGVFKDPSRWQGMKDAMSVQAKLLGQPPAEVIRGLDNLRRLTLSMESRPSTVGMSPQEIAALSGGSVAADSLRTMGMMPFGSAARRLQAAIHHKTDLDFDRILTSPEGAEMLAKLGSTPVMSKKAQTLLSGFYSSQGLSEPESPGITGQ